MSAVNALSFSGRLRVMTATPSATSRSTTAAVNHAVAGAAPGGSEGPLPGDDEPEQREVTRAAGHDHGVPHLVVAEEPGRRVGPPRGQYHRAERVRQPTGRKEGELGQAETRQ